MINAQILSVIKSRLENEPRKSASLKETIGMMSKYADMYTDNQPVSFNPAFSSNDILTMELTRKNDPQFMELLADYQSLLEHLAGYDNEVENVQEKVSDLTSAMKDDLETVNGYLADIKVLATVLEDDDKDKLAGNMEEIREVVDATLEYTDKRWDYYDVEQY